MNNKVLKQARMDELRLLSSMSHTFKAGSTLEDYIKLRIKWLRIDEV